MKANKLGRIKETIIFGRALRATLAASAIFVMAFVLVPYVVSEASAANQASAGVAWTSVSLTLNPDYDASNAAASWAAVGNAGHGDVDFGSFIPSSVGDGNLGTQKVVKKTIAVETNGREYQVFLSTADGTDALTLSGGGTTIDAMGGTWSTPAAFSGKGWGYAVPSVTGHTTAFSAASVYANYDSLIAADTQITKASHSSIYNTGTWAAVPKLTVGAQQIWKASTNNLYGFGGEHGDATEDKFNIYYSAIVDTTLVAGEYTNNIIYTALASSATIDTVSNNLARTQEYIFGGDTENITFDLAMSTPTISVSQVKVYLVPHSVVHANRNTTTGEYTDTGLSGYKTSTYECGSITNFSVTDKKASLTCTVPSNPGGAGNTGGGSSMAGEYDLYLTVDVNNDGTADYKYVSQYTRDGSEVGTVMYAGLQSKRRDGTNYVITEMQEMTPSICKNTNRWSTGIGGDARVHNYTGTGTALASTAAASAAIGTGTFLLKDNRDSKTYIVRHLADDKCWMVQNLDLNLATVGTLTSANTNLNTKDSWNPSAKMKAKSSTLEGGQAVANYQFQNDSSFGSSLLWGSICAEGTGPLASGNCSSISVANNANAAYARSYNNDSATATSTGSGNGPAYITGTQNVRNATTCAGYTDQQTGGHDECRMDGAIGNVGSGTANGLTRDTKWQPETITTSGGSNVNGSDTFTMRGSMYVGDYYNWYAATAETIAFTTGVSSDDICPRGWRLPVNDENSDGSWTKLLRTTYGATGAGYGNGASIAKAMQLPLSIPMAGYYNWTNGTLGSRGYYGYFWSSNAYSSTNANYLGMYYSGYFNPQDGLNKVYGLTIRCVSSE